MVTLGLHDIIMSVVEWNTARVEVTANATRPARTSGTPVALTPAAACARRVLEFEKTNGHGLDHASRAEPAGRHQRAMVMPVTKSFSMAKTIVLATSSGSPGRGMAFPAVAPASLAVRSRSSGPTMGVAIIPGE